MKPAQTIEEQINEAVEDVRVTMLADIAAGKNELNASVLKKKTHSAAVAANERLQALRRDY